MLVFISGHYFVFKTVQNQYTKNFKEYLKTLPEEKWESVEIASNQLYKNGSKITWLDDNKEIEMNGQLYDVVKIKHLGNKVKIYLVNDTNEKALKKNYNQIANSLNENNSKKASGNPLKELFSIKVIIDNPLGVCKPINDTSVCFASESKTNTNIGYTTVSTPPPISPGNSING
jgi:hypothetical protein